MKNKNFTPLVVLNLLLLAVTGLASDLPRKTNILPLDQIHAGMSGVAYTVFQGTTPESMEVEVLGVLKDVNGPKGDVILVRLHGPKVEYTGVVAGMSGSPVYIDGKLVGALAYRIGQFSKEPICGITPIEQMLETRVEPQLRVQGPGRSAQKSGERSAVSDQNEIVKPIETPLVFSGFSQQAV